MLESQIQKMIIDYLKLKHIMFVRHTPVKITGKGQFLQVSADQKGVADLILCIGGRYIELEIKNAKGIQSDYQKAHEEMVKKNGDYALEHIQQGQLVFEEGK